MKKILALCAVLMLVPSLSYGMMIEPGTVEIGGGANLNYSSATTEFDAGDVDTTNFGLSGLANYYFMNNFGAGLFLQYNDSETEFGGNKDESSSFLIGPDLKYQFGISEQTNLFLLGSLGYSKFDSGDTDGDGWYLFGQGGVSYFLSSTVAVNATVSYQYDSFDVSGDDVTRNIIAGGVGLSVYLR